MDRLIHDNRVIAVLFAVTAVLNALAIQADWYA